MNKRQRKKKFKKELRRKILIDIITNDPEIPKVVYESFNSPSLMSIILGNLDVSINGGSNSFRIIKSSDLRCKECGKLIIDKVHIKTRSVGITEEQDFNLCINCKNKKQ